MFYGTIAGNTIWWLLQRWRELGNVRPPLLLGIWAPQIYGQ